MSDPAKYLDNVGEAARVLGGWEPEVAMEAVRMYGGLPGMIEDIAGGIGTVADQLGDTRAFSPDSVDALDSVAHYMATVAEYAEEVRDIFRAEHAEQIEALENPSPADAMWSPEANRDYI